MNQDKHYYQQKIGLSSIFKGVANSFFLLGFTIAGLYCAIMVPLSFQSYESIRDTWEIVILVWGMVAFVTGLFTLSHNVFLLNNNRMF